MNDAGEFGNRTSGLRCALAAILVASLFLLIAPALVRAELPDAVGIQTPPEVVTLAASLRRAGKLCKGRELDAARDALIDIHRSFVRDFGPGHAATEIVGLSLVQVKASLGIEEESPTAPDATAEQETLDASLARALKKLRSCAALPIATAKPPTRLEQSANLSEGGFEPHMRAARALAEKGHYGAAAASAERAHSLAIRDKDPASRLRAAQAVALLRLQVGDFEGAVESAREADAAAKAQGEPGARIPMARLLAQVHHLEEAGRLLAELSLVEWTDATDRAEFAEARGDFAMRLGAPSRAISLLTDAVAGHEKQFGIAHASTAAVLLLRGSAHQMAGDLPAARSDFQRALEIRKKVYGLSHPEVARTLNALGVLHSDLKDWPEAERAFRGSLEILVDGFGEGHPEVATVRANQVLVAWARNRDAEAAEEYARVIHSLERAYGEGHPTVSDARRNLARMRERLGDATGAESLLDLALTAQLASLGDEHPALASTLIARGKFFGRQNRLAEAHASLSRAVDLLGHHFGDEHPLVARARMARSRVATAQGASAEAFEDSRIAARIFDLHLYRSFGALPDRQRALLAADAAGVVGALLSAQTDDPRQTYIATIPQRDAVLRSIATSRAEARRSSAAAGGVLSELEKLRSLYVAAVLSQSPNAAERARELADQIDAQESVVSLAQGSRRDLDASEILHTACRNLPDDASLIEFVGYDRVREGMGINPEANYLALVVRPKSAPEAARECSVTRVELGPAAAIDTAADHLAVAMRDQKNDAPRLRARLGELLLAPLEPALKGSNRWLLIPDGSLWGVPFSALPDPENPEHYIIERVTSGTLTSIHELTHYSVEPQQEEATALLFGAPEFGVAAKGEGPVVLTASGPCRIEPFEPLPGTIRELEEIRELMPGARLVIGADAKKDRLYLELQQRTSILHLATHAYFAGGGGCEGTVSTQDVPGRQTPIAPNPLLLSGIVFAGANGGQRIAEEAKGELTSGILTAYEASGLDLSTSRLVVLSACDTGTGLHRRGQEVQGLRWGFRAAGAKSLVTSLWRSNDIVTRKLMRRLYESLAQTGVSKDLFEGAEALRRAQLDRVAREKRLKLKKPLTWANFVFSGLY